MAKRKKDGILGWVIGLFAILFVLFLLIYNRVAMAIVHTWGSSQSAKDNKTALNGALDTIEANQKK